VPGARSALLLLGQRQKLEAGEECGEAGQVAIIVWVRLGVTAANEGVRRDRPAAAELLIALRQHSTLVEPVRSCGTVAAPFATVLTPSNGSICPFWSW
jgi:hypothetical protein